MCWRRNLLAGACYGGAMRVPCQTLRNECSLIVGGPLLPALHAVCVTPVTRAGRFGVQRTVLLATGVSVFFSGVRMRVKGGRPPPQCAAGPGWPVCLRPKPQGVRVKVHVAAFGRPSRPWHAAKRGAQLQLE